MYIVPKQKWRYPMAIEREYAKDLVRYVEAEMKIVESFLPEMVEAVWRNRLQKDSFNDDGLGDWLGNLVKKVENKIAKVLSPVKAIEKTFAKVAKHVKEQFGGIFKSVFGAKPKAAKGEAVKLETMKNLWVNENLDLIKSVDRNVLDSVRRTLTEKVVAAADKKILMSDLTAEIERLTGVSRTRAALIGADQVGKLHGRLARHKQMSEGIERYIWVTRGDKRVRPAHKVRHGVSYRWDSPPDGGHPGEAIRCRCVAQPCIDEDKVGLKPQKSTYTKANESGIINSGAISGALDPESERAERHAIQYYEAVRKRKGDEKRIAQNTDFSEEEIRAVKNYIFVEEHDLGTYGKQRFYPSYYMAESWRRLSEGKDIKPHDITMIQHELLERSFVLTGMSQREAHIKASQKYNYSKEVDEYYAENRKRKENE